MARPQDALGQEQRNQERIAMHKQLCDRSFCLLGLV